MYKGIRNTLLAAWPGFCARLLGFCAFCGVAGGAHAQLPETGTAESPRWYYIQVKGDEGRRGLVFTTEEGTDAVSGRTQVQTADMEAVAAQLWRFEKDDAGYTAINMATGKELGVTYDARREISHAVVEESSAARFSLVPEEEEGGEWYQMRSNMAPAGGAAGELYLHQANAGGERNYVIMMVGNAYAAEANSFFRFLPFEDFRIEFSTDGQATYYRMVSASAAHSGLCVTEAGNSIYPLTLEAENEADATQQWMLRQKGGEGGTGVVELVNRHSGRALQVSSSPYGAFNLPVLGSPVDNDGWKLNYMGQSQYSIGGEEEDGIVRYLGACVETEMPPVLDGEPVPGSAFAWKFVKAGISTAIGSVAQEEEAVVRVENGGIAVDGNVPHRVYTLDGKEVPSRIRLPKGIYLVKTPGHTTKIMIP
ncbi:MAG: RICIN domain-containing protein [Paraprevotella sp.]|nr:RICIN domain-containing protein [Paraprevotella sp.]